MGDVLAVQDDAPDGAPLRVVRYRWHLGVFCEECGALLGELYAPGRRSPMSGVRDWFHAEMCVCG